MSSSASPQPAAAWLPEPREPGDELPVLPPSDSLPDPEPVPPRPLAGAALPDSDLVPPDRHADPLLPDLELVPPRPPAGTAVPDADDGTGQTASVATVVESPVGVSELPLLPFAQVLETYVGWGTRLCALAIDLVALVLPFAAGVLVDSALMAYGVPMVQGQLTVIPLVLAAIVWNRGVWQGRTGQSLGKKAMGIRLVRESTSLPVGVGVALLRELAHLVDTVSLVGWLNPMWSGKRQTFADQIVHTVVLG
ncbi:RDD family protein [Cellulomonas sp. ICMP 17802]|uniref:RDD family protein n=1 Tax=Cellulomonas sp. ICMP 17802 TaxID=3239199 RepID=UPI00351BDCC9